MATTTLDRLLSDEPSPRIDLLSLDVEGHEFEALCSLSVSELPPVIISEFSTEGIGEDFRLRYYLEDRGYRVAHRTVANLIFLKC